MWKAQRLIVCYKKKNAKRDSLNKPRFKSAKKSWNESDSVNCDGRRRKLKKKKKKRKKNVGARKSVEEEGSIETVIALRVDLILLAIQRHHEVEATVAALQAVVVAVVRILHTRDHQSHLMLRHLHILDVATKAKEVGAYEGEEEGDLLAVVAGATRHTQAIAVEVGHTHLPPDHEVNENERDLLLRFPKKFTVIRAMVRIVAIR